MQWGVYWSIPMGIFHRVEGHLSPCPMVRSSSHNRSTWACPSDITGTSLCWSVQENLVWKKDAAHAVAPILFPSYMPIPSHLLPLPTPSCSTIYLQIWGEKNACLKCCQSVLAKLRRKGQDHFGHSFLHLDNKSIPSAEKMKRKALLQASILNNAQPPHFRLFKAVHHFLGKVSLFLLQSSQSCQTEC